MNEARTSLLDSIRQIQSPSETHWWTAKWGNRVCHFQTSCDVITVCITKGAMFDDGVHDRSRWRSRRRRRRRGGGRLLRHPIVHSRPVHKSCESHSQLGQKRISEHDDEWFICKSNKSWQKLRWIYLRNRWESCTSGAGPQNIIIRISENKFQEFILLLHPFTTHALSTLLPLSRILNYIGGIPRWAAVLPNLWRHPTHAPDLHRSNRNPEEEEDDDDDNDGGDDDDETCLRIMWKSRLKIRRRHRWGRVMRGDDVTSNQLDARFVLFDYIQSFRFGFPYEYPNCSPEKVIWWFKAK